MCANIVVDAGKSFVSVRNELLIESLLPRGLFHSHAIVSSCCQRWWL